MPIETTVDTAQRCVFSIVRGSVTADEMHEHLALILGTPGFAPDFSSVMDLREAGPFTLPVSTLRGFFDLSPYGPTSLRAHVVSAPAMLGLVRMSELSSDGRHGIFKFFSDPAEAYKWVGAHP